MKDYKQKGTKKNLRQLNETRIQQYLDMPSSFKKDNSVPLVVSSDLRDLYLPFRVMLYFPSNTSHQVFFHGENSKMLDLCNILEKRYIQNLGNNKYTSSYIYKVLLHTFFEMLEIGFIPNYLIKTGSNSKSNIIPTDVFNEFNLVDIKEYEVINPHITILLTGNTVFSQKASNLFMNDEKIVLSKEKPVNSYKDFRGKPIIFTYHPSFWYKLGMKRGINGEERIFRLIKDEILKVYTDWKNVNNKTKNL